MLAAAYGSEPVSAYSWSLVTMPAFLVLLSLKDHYLFSISAAQHVAAHDVDEVGLWVQLAHQPAESPPEPGHSSEAKEGSGRRIEISELVKQGDYHKTRWHWASFTNRFLRRNVFLKPTYNVFMKILRIFSNLGFVVS